MADNPAKIEHIITIMGTIRARSGLRIGAQESSLVIGGVDNPVVRDPLTRQPYIPGSSLKGKMRSLLERVHGLDQEWPIQRERVHIHVCKSQERYQACRLCQLFGVPAPERERWLCQTRLRFGDTFLTDASAKRLVEANTDLPYTELKAEAAIDRVTSAAVPRTMERVPAGSEFGPCEIALFIYTGDDVEANLDWLVSGLELIEADALGASSARGSGRVEFRDLGVRRLKTEGGRLQRSSYGEVASGLGDLRRNLGTVVEWARS